MKSNPNPMNWCKMLTNCTFETPLNPEYDIGYVSHSAAQMEENGPYEFFPSDPEFDFPFGETEISPSPWIPGSDSPSDQGNVSPSPVPLAAGTDNCETKTAGANRNGKQKVSDELPKGSKKGPGSFHVGESSKSPQQPESESESEAEEVPEQDLLTDSNNTIKPSGPTPSSSNLPLQNSVTFGLAQAQDKMKEPSGTVANRQTKRKGSVKLSKAKKTKKGARPFLAGESSKSSQQPEAEAEAGAAAAEAESESESESESEAEAEGKEVSVEDLLKTKPVSKVLKVLTDRVNRVIKGDKETDMLDCLRLTLYMMVKDFNPCPIIALYLEQMIKEWPARPDTIAIKETIKKIKVEEGENKKERRKRNIAGFEVPNEMNHRMRQVEKAIKKSAKERKQESRKSKNLEILLREMKDNMVDKSTCLLTYLMEEEVVGLHLPVLRSMNQIRQRLPTQSNLIDLKKRISGTEDEETRAIVDKLERRVNKLREETDMESVKQQKISEEVDEAAKLFVTEGVSCVAQRQMLSSIWTLGQNRTIGQATVQDHGSLQTGILKNVEDIRKKVFAKDNNKVDVSEFPGLKEAWTPAGDIPDYLKPIACKIEEARGTPTLFVQKNIQLLVCAAVKEMQDQLQDLPLDQLNERKLLKWGATLNLAKQFSFEVHFAESLLQKNLFAHFGFLVSQVRNVG